MSTDSKTSLVEQYTTVEEYSIAGCVNPYYLLLYSVTLGTEIRKVQ